MERTCCYSLTITERVIYIHSEESSKAESLTYYMMLIQREVQGLFGHIQQNGSEREFAQLC